MARPSVLGPRPDDYKDVDGGRTEIVVRSTSGYRHGAYIQWHTKIVENVYFLFQCRECSAKFKNYVLEQKIASAHVVVVLPTSVH